MSCFKDALKWLRDARRTIVLILAPVVLSPLLVLFDSKEARCGYGLSLMVVYWVGEALPYAVTSLLPLVVFPLLSVASTKDVGKHYFQEDSMLVLGTLILGVALESSQLDTRLALRTLIKLGSNPRWLMLVMMTVAWSLSLLLDTAASVALVIPVVSAVLRQLKNTRVKRSPSLLGRHMVQKALTPKPEATSSQWKSILSPRRFSKGSEKRKSRDAEEMTRMMLQEESGPELDTKLSPATSPTTFRSISKGASLCVAYAANIGGMGLLSRPVADVLRREEAEGVFQGVDLVDWVTVALPASLLCLLAAWFSLTLLFLGPRSWTKKKRRDKVKDALVKETLLRQYQKLGPITFSEKVVIGHYLLLLCALLTKDPPGVSGWSSLFPQQMVGGSAVAVLVALSLFVFPAQRPQAFCWRSGSTVMERRVAAVVDWRSLQARFPWAVLMLMGGGQAVIAMVQDSGLCQLIVRELEMRVVSGWGLAPWLLSLVLAALVPYFSQVAGGPATLTLLTGALVHKAIDLEVSPLYLLLPCAIATSFTFVLPMATASNAIVFATGHLEVMDLVRAGRVVHVLCALITCLALNTWGTALLPLSTLPPSLNVSTLTSFDVTSTTAAMMASSSSSTDVTTVFSGSGVSSFTNDSNFITGNLTTNVL